MTASDWMKVIAGVVATLGFSILFRLRPRHWCFSALSALLGCIVLFLTDDAFDGLFLPNFLSALAVAAAAELFAVLLKAPSTVFLLTGVIVLVPGGLLFYGMRDLLVQHDAAGYASLYDALVICLGIGCGIISASFFRYLFHRVSLLIHKSRRKDV